ncbi:amidohydrolase family protein [Streptomyces europaeiscabiei]|uniref:amidohydrolase family protein n=1 Tax=Streptomyces europaeiscabiei TaxID=146819 RepID=UPI0038F5F67B
MVDLPGGALLPTFGDGRVHPVVGGLGLLGAPVRACTSVDGIVEAVRRWAGEHPEAEWITGDGFDAWLAPAHASPAAATGRSPISNHCGASPPR